ncbi:MAG TPA: hypothetical protein PL033_03915 [Candidatus Brocadiia bacterium]|nr:hypothetical protein [Candidatus Brocadiia bacterium]
MDMIQTKCPNCGKINKAPQNLMGKRGKCPACRVVMVIGGPSKLLTDDALKTELQRLAGVKTVGAGGVSADDLGGDGASAPAAEKSGLPVWAKVLAAVVVLGIIGAIAFALMGRQSAAKDEEIAATQRAVQSALLATRNSARAEAASLCRKALEEIHAYQDTHREDRFPNELRTVSAALTQLEGYDAKLAQFREEMDKGLKLAGEKKEAEAKAGMGKAGELLAELQKTAPKDPDTIASAEVFHTAKAKTGFDVVAIAAAAPAPKPPEATAPPKPSEKPAQPPPQAPKPAAPKPQPEAIKPAQPKPALAQPEQAKPEPAKPDAPKPEPAPQPPAPEPPKTADATTLVIEDCKGNLRWAGEPAWSNEPALKFVQDKGAQVLAIGYKPGQKDKWVATLPGHLNLKPYRYLIVTGQSKSTQALNIALGLWPPPSLYESRGEFIRPGKEFRLVFDLQSQTFKCARTDWANTSAVDSPDAIGRMSIIIYGKGDFGEILIDRIVASQTADAPKETQKTAAPEPAAPKAGTAKPGKTQDGQPRQDRPKGMRRRPAGK